MISPCRDESRFMRRTLDTVLEQTVRPDRWVIVDDGSTDATADILAEYEAKHDFITVLHRPDRGNRSVGPGVVEAFYYGYDSAETADFDYVCKLDLDLELPPRYFETLLRRFPDNPRLGTCSGKPYFLDRKGKLVSEKCGDENSVGMTKLYRRQCFEEIGGFVRQVMWDAIDGHRCRMLGWIAVSWDEPDLRFVHLRPMGSSQQGVLRGRMRHGYGQYFMGTGFWYMTASALYRMTRPPLVIGGLAMWWGYAKSKLQGKERFDDAAFESFLRHYQRACLLRGKTRASRRLNEQRYSVWSRDRHLYSQRSPR